ncbi:NUDIX domain-containing protein [Paenibacillus sp. KN14-4R]|uniref:NUDIX domain-containing protein n=1 Tax=Paenibacillus sp. KN14-4R TaxID=3445773 RepID=UPI003FA09101
MDEITKPIFHGTVHVLFYRQPHEVLLLKRKNTEYAPGMWSVVGGRIDGGEQVKEAAIREAKEEAGVSIDPADLEVVGLNHRLHADKSEWMDFYLRVDTWQGNIVNMEPSKCEELRWFSIHELPDHMIPFVRKALTTNHDQMWFDHVGWDRSI